MKVLKVVKIVHVRYISGRLNLIDDFCGEGYEEFGSAPLKTVGCTFASHLLDNFLANAEP